MCKSGCTIDLHLPDTYLPYGDSTMIDENASVSVVIFPSLYKQISSILNAGEYVVVEGKVEIKESITIIANNIKQFKFRED